MSDVRQVEATIQTGADRWLLFASPARIIQAVEPEDVRAAIAEVERLTRDSGYYAVGYLAYEAGAAFGLPTRRSRGPDEGQTPLAWFALFEPASVREVDGLPRGESYELGPLAPSLDSQQFADAFGRIRQHLADGDTYQVNFTFRMRGTFSGDPRALFVDLVQAQKGRYSSFLVTGDQAICSASPELFFELEGLDVLARPMKGTTRRGLTLEEDCARRDELRASPKQRAENVMIVDMMRNDIGKIADVGTVDAPELFIAERYPNVWQMTSVVTARSRASLEEIFAALHPSASVTGAPKVRTMEILNTLEPEARGIYTGAIGYVRPDGNARFSVAIRTAVIDCLEHHVEFGVGSGIVWDSDAAGEYEECLLKGAVLGHRARPFDLLETLAWTPERGFALLDRHLARLRDSAEYFAFGVDEGAVRAALESAASGWTTPRRVRLLVSPEGVVRVEQQPLVPWGAQPVRVALAASAIDRRDPFFFHKTTNRAPYDRARTEGVVDGVDEVILWNADGEITEGTTANVAVELEDGAVVTPPVSCGLLAGTYRADALARGRLLERVITVQEFRAARRIRLMNSVHGEREAVLVTSGRE